MNKSGVVTCPVLNVRSGPDKGFPCVDRLLFNTQVTVLDTHSHDLETWYKIGEYRWVHGGWIRLK